MADSGKFMLPSLSSPQGARSISCPPLSPEKSLEKFLGSAQIKICKDSPLTAKPEVATGSRTHHRHDAREPSNRPSNQDDASDIQPFDREGSAHSMSHIIRSSKRLAKEWKSMYSQLAEEEEEREPLPTFLSPKIAGPAQTEKLSRQTASLILRRLQMQLEESKKRSLSMTEAAESRRKEVVGLLNECKKMARERERSREELHTQQVRIDELGEELGEVQKSKAVTQDNLRHLREDKKKQEAHLQALLADKTAQLSQATEELEEATERQEDLEDRLEDAALEIRKLEKKLEQYKEHRQKTGQKVAEDKKKLNEKIQEIASSPGDSRPTTANESPAVPDSGGASPVPPPPAPPPDDEAELERERERLKAERRLQRFKEKEEKRKAQERDRLVEQQCGQRKEEEAVIVRPPKTIKRSDTQMSLGGDVALEGFDDTYEHLKTIQLQLDSSSSELQKAQARLQELELEQVRFEEVTSALEAEKEQRDRRIVELTGQVNKLKEELKASADACRQLEGEKAEAVKAAEDMQTELEVLKVQAEHDHKELNKVKAANIKQADHLDQRTHECVSLRQQVVHLNEALLKGKDREAKLQRELSFNQERVAAIDAKYQEIKNDLISQEKIIKTFEDGHRSEMEVHILNELHVLQTSVERKERRFEVAQKDMEQKLADLEHAALASAEDAQQASSKLLETRKELDRTKNDLEEFREKHSLAQEARSRLEALSDEQSAQLRELKSERDRMRATLDRLEGLDVKCSKLEDELDMKARQLEEALELAQTLQEHLEGVRSMWEKEQLLKHNVKKLLTACEALEGNLSCMVCTRVLEDAVTLAPCGHNICRQCWLDRKGEGLSGRSCPECGRGMMVSSVVANKSFAPIIANVEYQRQVLETLKSGHEDFMKLT